MRFPINIRHDEDRDVWSGSCPSIRGVSAVADSEDELKDNLTGELYSRLQELMDRRARIHIPKDVDDKDCYIELPFRAIAKLKVLMPKFSFRRMFYIYKECCYEFKRFEWKIFRG